MPLLLSFEEIQRAEGRAKRAKRMKPVKNPAKAERDFERKVKRAWDEILRPAAERVLEARKRGDPPEAIADIIEQAAREAEWRFGVLAEDVVDGWLESVDVQTREALRDGLQHSLGVDITAVLDSPEIKTHLDAARMDAVGLIKTIPQEFLAQVSQATAAHYRGQPLPEGRTLAQQLRHLGGISKRRARLIARDQTTKITGALNQARQEDLGVTEYIWRTVKDNRVVGNPTGLYPAGNKRHEDHYHRDGKKFHWDKPPSDGHPGWAIQCRCWAEPVIDVKKILKKASVA